MFLEKENIRKEYLKKRDSLSKEEQEKQSNAIKHLLFSSLMIHRFSVIHTYLPLIGEPDTYGIIKLIEKDFNADIYVPKMQEKQELSHIKYRTENNFIKNKFGVLEPKEDGISSAAFFQNFKEEDILVLIPLLAYSKEGHRVGFGKGFYDRFLSFATPKTLKVGLSFFEPLDQKIKINETDVALNYCISPKKVWTFTS